jgi:hypothetical protein
MSVPLLTMIPIPFLRVRALPCVRVCVQCLLCVLALPAVLCVCTACCVVCAHCLLYCVYASVTTND